MTYSTMEEVTRKEPEKSLLVPLKKTGEGMRSAGDLPIPGGRAQASLPGSWISSGTRMAFRPKWPASSTTRTAPPTLPCFTMRTEKSATSWPSGTPGRRSIGFGFRSGDSAGQCLPLKDIPLGTFVHNIELSKGHGGQMARGAGSYAQAHGQGRQTRPAQVAFGRGAHGVPGLQSDHRPGWATSSTRTSASARPGENDGWVEGPMFEGGHEPCGSSPWGRGR